jgi:hypothetical protein
MLLHHLDLSGQLLCCPRGLHDTGPTKSIGNPKPFHTFVIRAFAYNDDDDDGYGGCGNDGDDDKYI